MTAKKVSVIVQDISQNSISRSHKGRSQSGGGRKYRRADRVRDEWGVRECQGDGRDVGRGMSGGRRGDGR